MQNRDNLKIEIQDKAKDEQKQDKLLKFSNLQKFVFRFWDRVKDIKKTVSDTVCNPNHTPEKEG
jgi:hypothetical protein